MVGQKIGKTDGWMSNIQSSLRPTSFWHFPKKVYLIPGWFQADMAWESWSHAEGPIWGFQAAALKGMKFVCLSIHLFPSSGLPGLITGLYGLKSALSGFKSALPSLKSALSSLKFSICSLSSALAGFLGSDPKGPMSCKTQGGISRRPSFLWSVHPPPGWPLGRLPGGSNLVKF